MKKIVLILCVVMIFSVFTVGCQSQKTDEKVKNNNSEQKAEQNNESEKDVTITLVAQDFSPSNPDDIQFMEEVYKKAGIKVQLVEIPSGNYSEKLNVLLASANNIPDIIWFRDGVDKIYAEQGLLLNMNDFVKNSEVFKNSMPKWNAKRLENYPYLLAINEIAPKVALVREDWMKQLNLEVPKTLDDYYLMLKTFAQSDLDGNSEKDTFGITDTGNTNRMDAIFNAAFGIETTWMKDNDGKYVYKYVTPNEKEKLAFYRQLYQEKILDPEYLTVNWQSMEDKLYSGKVGMVSGSVGIVMDLYTANLKERGIDTQLIALEPPIGKNGKSGLRAVGVSRENRGFAITKTSKHPEKAFELLEFFMTDEGQMIDRLGIKGREYVEDESGKLKKTEKGLTWWSRFFEVPTWESPIPVMSENARNALDMTKEYYKEDIVFSIPTEKSGQWDEMQSLYKEYASRIIMGEYDLNKFDEFVDKWYKAGGEEISKLANEALK